MSPRLPDLETSIVGCKCLDLDCRSGHLCFDLGCPEPSASILGLQPLQVLPVCISGTRGPCNRFCCLQLLVSILGGVVKDALVDIELSSRIYMPF